MGKRCYRMISDMTLMIAIVTDTGCSDGASLAPLHNKDWVVYAKRPFGGPEIRASILPDSHSSGRSR
jgi:hypothetical protein